jgi:hypothetical protein
MLMTDVLETEELHERYIPAKGAGDERDESERVGPFE